MQTIRHVNALRALIDGQRRAARRIGFVPTMGNLHAGHFSLVEIARKHCDFVVASVFVNPTQFGAGEDFSRYPRTPEQDAEGLDRAGCDCLFLPEVDEIYPFGPGQGVRVTVPGLGEVLEGASRPGHFDGVATVVARLFNAVAPDLAVFGSKDYQQLLVVRRMSRDLGFPIEIIGAPIVREANGLAMSSRNQYLDHAQRQQAGIIHAVLQSMCSELASCDAPIAAIEMRAAAQLVRAGLVPDYAVFRTIADLAIPAPQQSGDLVALIAARLGGVRLIDNMECRC
ncbi:MAG: pantoate--beta-alanine ligase [Dokdonella sp.]|uniref:pantoate--beta-alanine ligase n=1 Tax=Dokdonella sp. TaxID=2291710 RepID=UPI003BAE2B44